MKILEMLLRMGCTFNKSHHGLVVHHIILHLMDIIASIIPRLLLLKSIKCVESSAYAFSSSSRKTSAGDGVIHVVSSDTCLFLSSCRSTPFITTIRREDTIIKSIIHTLGIG
eukprot:769761_1